MVSGDWKREQRKKDMDRAEKIIVDSFALTLIEDNPKDPKNVELEYHFISCVLSDKLSLRLRLIKTDYMEVLRQSRQTFYTTKDKYGTRVILPTEFGFMLILQNLKKKMKMKLKSEPTIKDLVKKLETMLKPYTEQ